MEQLATDGLPDEEADATVGIVGGNALSRALLRSLLQDSNFRVSYERAGIDPDDGSERGKADVVLICLRPNEAEIEMKISQIRRRVPGVPVVAISEELSLPAMKACLNGGCSAYLQMNISVDAFLLAMNIVVLGSTVYPAEVRGLIDGGFPTGQRIGSDEGFRDLSPRERHTLEFLVRGMSNKAMAREMDVAEATVKVHLKSIMKKIHVQNRTQVVIWAYELERARRPFGGQPVPDVHTG